MNILRRTKVVFTRGFKKGKSLYGWANGELYRLTPTILKLKKSSSGDYKLVGQYWSTKRLTGITVAIDFVHFDGEKSMNAFRPALKRPEEGHGLKTGIPWKDMNSDHMAK